MRFLLSLYTCLLLLNNVSTAVSTDPCYDYNTLDEYWRNINLNSYLDYGHDDRTVEWNGWYRLYLNGETAQISEWCVSFMGCGGQIGLHLNGFHPRLEDGVVTRHVVGSHVWNLDQCGSYSSKPIQVKACPGDYYVYELVKPDVSLERPSYCAVSFSSISDDPCYKYESLDRPWRATTESGLYIYDHDFSWSGWYRLFHHGMNIQMQENCVNPYSCNTNVTLWLNGPHPQKEDGVVIREVCVGDHWDGCCDYKSKPIRVKACPGNYWVYELVSPIEWGSGYCTDVSTISPTGSTRIPVLFTESTITFSDPCSSYNILDDYWRSTRNYLYMYGYILGHDDTRVKWDGWYRLFIDGSSAQMPEWCANFMSCGGFSSLWLGGPHPRIEDGVVTREVHGSYYDKCSYYTSNPIQIKACPGDYYVYKLTKPNVAIPLPSYCAVLFRTPNVDPCDSYTSLDEPWRSTENHYNNEYMCDYHVEWHGWYRLYINGQSTQMPESCVSEGMCGTSGPLHLRDPHPRLEDGVVTRHVCMSSWNSCCGYESHPIQVKACQGNYYVYEFVRPLGCSAYCAAVSDPCLSLDCTEDEWCGQRNGVYGCFCKNNQTRSAPHSFDLSKTCEGSSGSLSLPRCQLFEAGFSANVLHLNDPSCRGTIQNGRVLFHFDDNNQICGTSFVANGTHIIYENFIFGTPESAEGVMGKEKMLKLSFSCIYPQTQTFSMIKINPLETILNKVLPASEERYQVRMAPFKGFEFSQPFTGTVNSEIDKVLVEVSVDGVDSRQFVTVIDTCWATPVDDPDHSLRWDLITGECPNSQDNTVELVQNGVSTSSRFSFRKLLFSSTRVYLHCAVHLCLVTTNECQTLCYTGYKRRDRRSLDFHDSSSISMGPLVVSDKDTDL